MTEQEKFFKLLRYVLIAFLFLFVLSIIWVVLQTLGGNTINGN